MENLIVENVQAKRRSILIGLAVIAATLAAGAAVAFATGISAPKAAEAFDFLPPCCIVIPPPEPPPPPLPDVLPPCCTVTPVPQPEPPQPDVLPPCCTITPIPEVPVVDTPTPPIVVPPPPPEVEEEGRCISLRASRSVITAPGQAVVLTWETDNVDSVSINNGVGRVSPTSGGSVTVYPTGNTTYVATVEGGDQSDNCRASVRLEVITNDNPRCVDLSANRTRLDEEGDAVVLSWVTANASSISINNGVGNVTPVSSGSITVHPRRDTTYVATVPGAPYNPDCEVTVRIDEERERDHDRDDHDRERDRERPEVFIDSVTRPNEPPLASVYLSEIPYTGLDLGPVGTVVYWTMIVLWSGAAAYLVLFNFLPYLFRRAATDALAESGHLPGWGPAAAAAAPIMRSAAPAPAVHQAAHRAAVATSLPQRSVAAAPTPAAPVYSPHEGFRSFATGGALTIDDIVKGLSRESDIAPVAPVMEAPAMAQAPKARTTAYADNIPGFIEALVNGDRGHVFGTVRNVSKQGGDPQDFLSEAVCALDDAYRARTEGADVHPEVARVTKDCHTSFLEKVIASLTTALDSTYSAGMTGTKLALTRALAVVNG